MFTTIYYKHVKENQICSLIDNIELSCIAYHPVIVSHVKKCNVFQSLYLHYTDRYC